MTQTQLAGDSSFQEETPKWGVLVTAPTKKGLRQWQKSVGAGGGFKVKLVKALFRRGYDFVAYQEDMEDAGLETKIVANKSATGYDLMVFRRWWTFEKFCPDRHHTTQKGV